VKEVTFLLVIFEFVEELPEFNIGSKLIFSFEIVCRSLDGGVSTCSCFFSFVFVLFQLFTKGVPEYLVHTVSESWIIFSSFDVLHSVLAEFIFIITAANLQQVRLEFAQLIFPNIFPVRIWQVLVPQILPQIRCH